MTRVLLGRSRALWMPSMAEGASLRASSALCLGHDTVSRNANPKFMFWQRLWETSASGVRERSNRSPL